MKHLLILTLAGGCLLAQQAQTLKQAKLDQAIAKVVNRIQCGEKVTGSQLLSQLHDYGVYAYDASTTDIVASLRKQGCLVKGTDQISNAIQCRKKESK